MTTFLQFLQQHAEVLLQAISSIIAGASILANFTPTDKDNKALGFLSKAIHFLAANFFAVRPEGKDE